VSSQKLLARGARLTELLKQPQYSPLTVEQQVISVFAGIKGYLDDVAVKNVNRFEEELLNSVRAAHPELLAAIRSEKQLSKENEEKLRKILEDFKKSFSA
jgi:F-type H+-transporting ATPase subunit alpha